MKCYDLFKLQTLNKMELLAGGEGLSNEINWVYFADTVEADDMGNWASENDLLITTGINISKNNESLSDYINKAIEKHIAGVIFNTGNFIKTIPDSVLESANVNKVPIFSVPWEQKLSAVSKEICEAIVKDRHGNDHNSLLNQLLFDDSLSELKLSQLILDSSHDFKKTDRLVVIDCHHQDESDPREHLQLQNKIIRIVNDYLPKDNSSMVIYKDTQVIMVLSDQEAESSRFLDLIKELKQMLKDYGFTVQAGISGHIQRALNIRSAYEDAQKALKIAQIETYQDLPVCFFDKAGIYSLLSQIGDSSFLHHFYENCFREIDEYDKTHSSDLRDTLREFIASGGNYIETADKLNLHRNTLRYRIDKIEQLSGRSMNDYETILVFLTAFKIEKLLKVI